MYPNIQKKWDWTSEPNAQLQFEESKWMEKEGVLEVLESFFSKASDKASDFFTQVYMEAKNFLESFEDFLKIYQRKKKIPKFPFWVTLCELDRRSAYQKSLPQGAQNSLPGNK